MGSGVTFESILGHFGVTPGWGLLSHFWVTLILSAFLGHPKPQKLAEMKLEISATGAVTRHGVVNWGNLGRNFGWVVLQWHMKHENAKKISSKILPILRPILRPKFRPVINTLRGEGTLISEPRFSTPCDMRFFPRDTGKMAIFKGFASKWPFSLYLVGKIAYRKGFL